MSTVDIAELVKDFDPYSFTNKEAQDIERVTGMTFSEWGGQLRRGSITAMTAAVWALYRRTNPEIRIDDVEFNMGDVLRGNVVTEDTSGEEERGEDAPPTGPTLPIEETDSQSVG